MPDSDSPPIATEVRARRVKLGLSQEDVALAAKQAGHPISVPTIREIEYGHRTDLRRNTKQGLAAGLSWPVSKIDALLAGNLEDVPEPSIMDADAIRRLVAQEIRSQQSAPAADDELTEAIFGLDEQSRTRFLSLLDLLRQRIIDADERSRRADEA